MPKRTNDFQALIKTIYEQIVPEEGSVTESGMIFDSDAGILREVDILVEYQYAGHQFSFMVECRDWSRAQSVEWIDSLIGKAKSLKVDKIIAVSSRGFVPSAVKKAKENGIETLTLTEANDKDWLDFPIKPALTLITDDNLRISDVQYETSDGFVTVRTLGLKSLVEINDEVVGTVEGLTSYFFQEHLVPSIRENVKNNFSELFKTQEDLQKPLMVEAEFNWPGIYVINADSSKIELKKVKYIVTGQRNVIDVEQKHRVFNRKMVSTSSHLDADGSILDFNIVQDSDTNKMHVRWRRKGEGANESD